MVAEESDGSMQWFHFFDGIFLGQWYPEGFHAKSMVLKMFTPRNRRQTNLDLLRYITRIWVFSCGLTKEVPMD